MPSGTETVANVEGPPSPKPFVDGTPAKILALYIGAVVVCPTARDASPKQRLNVLTLFFIVTRPTP
jgi:hypothetical protein